MAEEVDLMDQLERVLIEEDKFEPPECSTKHKRVLLQDGCP